MVRTHQNIYNIIKQDSIMKVAAVQMKAVLGDVAVNLKKARALAEAAIREGARWVILPEFFTTAAGFSKKMHNGAIPLDGAAMDLLTSLARTHDVAVGGSYIAWHGSDCFNTFVLALPDGTTCFHNKDLPTMWENCYYTGGSDDGILETPSGKVGGGALLGICPFHDRPAAGGPGGFCGGRFLLVDPAGEMAARISPAAA